MNSTLFQNIKASHKFIVLTYQHFTVNTLLKHIWTIDRGCFLRNRLLSNKTSK